MNKAIAQVVFGLPVEGPFDYRIASDQEENCVPGCRVKVLFNRKVCMGIITGLKVRSAFKRLNPILEVLDNVPVLDENSITAACEMSRNFGCSTGEALETMLPQALRKIKGFDDIRNVPGKKTASRQPHYTLIQALSQDALWSELKGIIEGVSSQAKSLIVLVPDASQIGYVQEKLKGITDKETGVWDKQLTGKKEYVLWNRIKGGDVPVVLGTRSAIFSPLKDLGHIIVLDEDHSSYKQEQVPHYHIHQMAMIRSNIDNCDVTFVSISPSVELWKSSKDKNWNRVQLDDKASSKIQIIDMNNYGPKMSIVSIPLRNDVEQCLNENKKVVLYINKRGFGRVTRCKQCGYSIQCDDVM